MPFADLVKAVSNYVDTDPATTFVWLDVCAVNQHKANDLPMNDYLTAAIGGCKETLLCLDPQGVVLTRIWCLYEVGGHSTPFCICSALFGDQSAS